MFHFEPKLVDQFSWKHPLFILHGSQALDIFAFQGPRLNVSKNVFKLPQRISIHNLQ